MTDPNLIGRYQSYRTRRFLANERRWSTMLPRWRTRHRRRALVVGLAVTFVFMFAVSVVCAFGVRWAPLLWLPVCAAFFPLWTMLQIVSGRRGDVPADTLDEWGVEQRHSARSFGLTVTQSLVMIPVFYLTFGDVIIGAGNGALAHAGGLMTLTMLLIGGCTPTMVLGWTRPDPDPEDTSSRPVTPTGIREKPAAVADFGL
ncbi:hypothetical protein [Rhodococcus koreensis]|uniref:hypothetical protein n=1 Tax=Rhodococcus koreensis TaxID=99653 RepID=UPI00366BDB7A